MRYLAYITENCKNSAKKHGLTQEIEKLAKKIETDQSVDIWDFFIPSPFLKKNLGKNFRLVCAQQFHQEYILISFLDCLSRGGSLYNKFIKSHDILKRYVPDEKEIIDYIKKRENNIPESIPEPSPIEKEFLYNSFEFNDHSDMMIYESIDWVEQIKSEKILFL